MLFRSKRIRRQIRRRQPNNCLWYRLMQRRFTLPHQGTILRWLGWPAPVSRQQLRAFLSFGRGFRTPVSARFFPISVSGERRLVRELAETSSKNANGVGGSDAEAGQQPRLTHVLCIASLEDKPPLWLRGPPLWSRQGLWPRPLPRSPDLPEDASGKFTTPLVPIVNFIPLA